MCVPRGRGDACARPLDRTRLINIPGFLPITSASNVTHILLTCFFAGSVHFGPHLNDNRLHNAYGQFCGIDSEDRLLCWGRSLKPDSTMAEAVEPRVLSEGRWSQVGVGKNHLCALNKDDRLVYCMGSGSNGQLGDGSPVGKETKIKELTPIVGGKEFQYLTVGDNHACAIGVTQNAFCWGSNEYGQLGNGDRISSSTPLKVFSDVDSWTTISAGAEHTCGTKNAIEAWCWGNNLHREVNSSPEDSIVTPSRIDGSWRMVQAGDGYTLAIDGVGKGFGWGVNERVNVDFAYGGMLGDNSTTMCYDPATKTLCPEADEVAAKANSSDSDSTKLTETEILKTENIVPIAGDHLWSSITSGGRIPCGIEVRPRDLLRKLICSYLPSPFISVYLSSVDHGKAFVLGIHAWNGVRGRQPADPVPHVDQWEPE